MIDLPDYGYIGVSISPIDPGGSVPGILGGETTTIDRPGYRYSVQFTLPALGATKDARSFQAMLEQGAREDVSDPWPLDFKPSPAGTPVVDGASAAGAVIPIRGLTPNYQFKLGQPVAVVSSDKRSIHKASAVTSADASGAVDLPVFPYTRRAFADGDTIEVGHPRIGGILKWDGASQPAYGVRPFTFTIEER